MTNQEMANEEMELETVSAERARLATLPTCDECGTLIDELNGDEQFGDYHVECFREIVKRVKFARSQRQFANSPVHAVDVLA